jgi:hypothetical protein
MRALLFNHQPKAETPARHAGVPNDQRYVSVYFIILTGP